MGVGYAHDKPYKIQEQDNQIHSVPAIIYIFRDGLGVGEERECKSLFGPTPYNSPSTIPIDENILISKMS